MRGSRPSPRRAFAAMLVISFAIARSKYPSLG